MRGGLKIVICAGLALLPLASEEITAERAP
ncbi:hypothetical protein TP2_04385 [Thioclava pacifica DSM 10166]|uniref:Uncharacterized protein n=1 Tax=Thioclava pacifica DSM 10166 TaxID=1353537 RepID=A0A074JCC3_9RHOB|nr:hypothetical protein TP2_04385 [Thioclava pacifica DSM 10166]